MFSFIKIPASRNIPFFRVSEPKEERNEDPFSPLEPLQYMPAEWFRVLELVVIT